MQRIGEIIENVKKQEVEIRRILSDKLQVQRDINSAEESLHRAYSLADEVRSTPSQPQPSFPPLSLSLSSSNGWLTDGRVFLFFFGEKSVVLGYLSPSTEHEERGLEGSVPAA